MLAGLIESGSWHPTDDGEERLRDRLLNAGAVHPAPRRVRGEGDEEDLGEVTVVIPVRDDAPRLAAVLGDLSGTLPGTAGVQSATRVKAVVVDDGSRDPGAVRSLAAANGAVLVRHEQARGPAAARNSGLAVVDTPVTAFVDADVRVPARWLEPLLAHLEGRQVVAVAPRVRNTGGQGLLARYEEARGPLDLGAEPAIVRPRSRVPYVPSAALVVRTAGVRAVGGFDEDLRFGEDVDLVWRLGEAGGAVRYEPAVVVGHRPRANLTGWLGQRVDYGSSAAELAVRHRGASAPMVVSPWSALVWTLASVGHPVPAVGVAAGSAAALARRLPALGVRPAVALVMRGHLGAGGQIARALVRPWWPVTLGAALVSRRARKVALAAVASHLVSTPGRPLDRLVGLVDDMAYSVGVWKGAWAARDLGALLPAFTRWP